MPGSSKKHKDLYEKRLISSISGVIRAGCASVEEGAVCAADEEFCAESVPFVVLADGADASRLFKFTGACDCAFESPVKSIFLMESAEEAAFTPYKSALEA